MLSVTNGFKQAIKDLIVQSDGYVNIINSSGTLNFTSDDIQKIEIYGNAFQNDTVLGTIAQHSLTLELLGDLTSSISLSKENTVEVFLGVLVGASYEYVQYQDFIITEITYSDTTNITKITGTDYLVKLNKEYVDSNTYPLTLKSYLTNVLTYCGLQLENTTFLNDSFSVTSMPFNDYTSAKEIVYRVAEMALSYVVINKSTNKVELKSAFTQMPLPTTHEDLSAYTHDELSAYTYLQLAYSFTDLPIDDATKANYMSLKLDANNFATLGVNTLVLKISQVDGENNTVENSTNVAIDGDIEVNIIDNPFINTEALRLSVIDDMFDVVEGYKYQPYSLEYRGFPYLEIGDILVIQQMNGNDLVVPIFETTIRYNGGIYGKVNAKTLSITETSYKYISSDKQKVRNAEIIVDKVNADISLKVSYDDVINSINLSTEGITINANRLNISAYVTFTNLSTSGQTTINGGNITTGTLNASLCNVTNINASNISTGTLSASRIAASSITSDKLNVSTLSAINANVGTLTAGTIGGWTVNSSTISRNGITLGADYISLGNTGTTGSTINLGSAKIYNIGGSGVGFSSYITVASDISPQYDNTSALGSSYARFQEVWAVDGTINTSDMEDKTDIKLIENGVDFILNLKPVQFKWNDKVRNHYGFLAQEVKDAMTNSNIEDAGVYIDPNISGKDGYKGLRYNEFIAPMVQTIQSLEKRIKELENGN